MVGQAEKCPTSEKDCAWPERGAPRLTKTHLEMDFAHGQAGHICHRVPWRQMLMRERL